MDKKQTRRRKAIQFIAMLIYNADVKRWFSGGISHSPLKTVCVPGLNCYSCPGAIAACPLGSLQNTLANGQLPFFITGFFLQTRVPCGNGRSRRTARFAERTASKRGRHAFYVESRSRRRIYHVVGFYVPPLLQIFLSARRDLFFF